MNILYNNINGFTCKKDSLINIIQRNMPDVVCLCETKLGEKEEVNLKGYEAIPNNHKKGQEGLVVAAREGTFVSMEKVSDEHINILTVRIVYPGSTFRFIVCHGQQEDDESELRQDFFDNIFIEIERSRAADETPIVLGDMNAKISMDKDEVKVDSFNGKMLKNLLDLSEMKVTNFHENSIDK